MTTSAAPTCPECQSPLPPERQGSPWCECGWSSAADPALAPLMDKRARRKVEQSRRRAQRLADIDIRTIRLLRTWWGRFLWYCYLVIAVLLCLPVLFARVLFWGALAGLLLYFFVIRAWPLAWITGLVLGGLLVIRVLFKPRSRLPGGIALTPGDAPKLLAVVDEVTARLQGPPIRTVRLRLDANVGVRRHFVWRPRPRFEPELALGLLACYTLNISQLKAVLAHEVGHLQGLDLFLGTMIEDTLRFLNGWLAALQEIIQKGENRPSGYRLGLPSLVAYLFLKAYFRLLAWFARWASRRWEYLADRVAAGTYGREALLQALVLLGATDTAFANYVPAMIDNVENEYDRHDFFYQYVQHWENRPVPQRQQAYAQAVASFGSVYDTHPSYRDRRRALEQVESERVGQEDERPALQLLPKAAEMGRDLTVQLYRHWHDQR